MMDSEESSDGGLEVSEYLPGPRPAATKLFAPGVSKDKGPKKENGKELWTRIMVQRSNSQGTENSFPIEKDIETLLKDFEKKKSATKNRQTWKPVFTADDYRKSFEAKTLREMKLDDAQLFSFGVKIAAKRHKILKAVEIKPVDGSQLSGQALDSASRIVKRLHQSHNL